MKTIKGTVLLILVFIPGLIYGQENEDITIGIGTGIIYSGIGINVGSRDANSLKYLSLGCTVVTYSDNGEVNANCGLGVGWIVSDIITQENNKHGLGLHAGVTYNDLTDDSEVSLGISYVYFFEGIGKDGWNVGFSPGIRKHSKKINGTDELSGELLLQAGFQF